MKIGAKLKRLRHKNNLTLEELASRTELSKGFLSQLEHDLTSPSITTLEDICYVLGISLAEFFAQDKPIQMVFTKEDMFVDEQEHCSLHWIVPNAHENKMEPLIIELLPTQFSDLIGPSQAETFGYVLKGRVDLVSSKERQIVKAHQSFYVFGDQQYRLENTSKTTARVLWVSTPPIF